MTILVTGACGFVGSHIAAALGRYGETVVAADLGPPPPAVIAFWTGADVQYRPLDVTDRDSVDELLQSVAPRWVVHAAAITPTPAMEAAGPSRIVDVNLGGTVNVLDAATSMPGMQRVVVLSSAAVYGFGSSLPSPVPEDISPQGTGLYAVTKVASEGLARRFGELRGVSTAAVRVAAVYGAMERPTGHRGAMSQLYPLFAALRERRTIRVQTSDALRDWTDADDIGDGIHAVLAAPRLQHAVYNLSSGTAVPWSEVIALFRNHGLDVSTVDAAADADVTFDPAFSRPPLDTSRLAADTGFRARRLLADAVARIAASREPA